MHAAAAAVAHYLDLDVTRLAKILLDIDAVVAECRAGFRARRRQRLGKALFVARNLHAASAAACCCLDQHRVADVGGDALCLGLLGDRAIRPRNAGNAEAAGRVLGLDLVAHDADVLGARPDEGDAVRFQDLGKLGIFGKEAVAGMDGVRARDLARGQDFMDVEVAVARWRRPDANAFVGKAHMHRLAVRRRVDGDGRDAQFLAGSKNPKRNLAAVRNEYLVEHSFAVHSMIISGSPYSTGWPSSTRIAVTTPERGAEIWFMVFIASTIITVWPALTVSPIAQNGFEPGAGE